MIIILFFVLKFCALRCIASDSLRVTFPLISLSMSGSVGKTSASSSGTAIVSACSYVRDVQSFISLCAAH